MCVVLYLWVQHSLTGWTVVNYFHSDRLFLYQCCLKSLLPVQSCHHGLRPLFGHCSPLAQAAAPFEMLRIPHSGRVCVTSCSYLQRSGRSNNYQSYWTGVYFTIIDNLVCHCEWSMHFWMYWAISEPVTRDDSASRAERVLFWYVGVAESTAVGRFVVVVLRLKLATSSGLVLFGGHERYPLETAVFLRCTYFVRQQLCVWLKV